MDMKQTCASVTAAMGMIWMGKASMTDTETPLNFMLDNNADMLSFPGTFPYNTGSLTDECNVTLTAKKYFMLRLLNSN